MLLALVSFSMVLLGGGVAVAATRRDLAGAARGEWIGGGLLAGGLMLVGVGIELSLC